MPRTPLAAALVLALAVLVQDLGRAEDSDLYALQAGTTTRAIPGGMLVLGAGKDDRNAPRSWHIDPASPQTADLAAEVCDGRPSFVEILTEYFAAGSSCPWSSTPVSLEDHR